MKALALSIAGGLALTASAAGSTPNILWFVVEDTSAMHFSCYGEQLIATPNVDRLAREGTRFAHAFTTAPVCSASRSALITGMYQTSIGAHHHRSGRGIEKIYLPAGVVPIPALFRNAGYFTCIGNGLAQSGGKKAKHVGGDVRLGKTDYNFEWDPAIYDGNDWADRNHGQPFFMQVLINGGKLRGESDADAHQLLERARTELGSSTNPAKVTLPTYYPPDPVLLLDWAAYLDTVRLTDQHVGRVLASLEKEGVLDQTLVIFTTDHGISHARGKQFLYDEGTHVPLIVRGPGITAGQVRDDLIEQMDMGAISLTVAGIPLPGTMQAQNSLADEYRPREFVFAARDRCDETVDRIRSVRSERFLYIRNFYSKRPLLQPNVYKDAKDIIKRLKELHASHALDPLAEKLLFSPERPVEELYEWKTDRWQVKNLANETGHQTTLDHLRARLDRWMEETQDQGPESEISYDSTMAEFFKTRAESGKSVEELEANIRLMKEWAKEGK